MINAISSAISGMAAAMKRLETSASNVANAGTSGSIEEGGKPPYAAQTVQQTTITTSDGDALGIRTQAIPKDPSFVHAYEPNSPFANEDGIIGMPNVNFAEEAVSMKLAEFSYKANIQTIKAADEMMDDLLKIVDKKA